MLSIGQFAEMAQVSARTVRYYESIGLLPQSSRGENNYRYYDRQWLSRMTRIRDLQSLGFSLEDIKVIINFSDSELQTQLQEKLLDIENEIEHLENRRQRVNELLSVTNKIEAGEKLTETERTLFMESLKSEIINGLRDRYTEVNDTTLAYLKRDTWLESHPQVTNFIDAVKKVIEFARSKNLITGPIRGSASSSLSLFGLGISGVDPLKHEMIPERLSTQTPFFHFDVEYARGQELVDYCHEINRHLPYGEIQAFKMPLIDVVKNTHQAIDQVIDYDNLDDNSDTVLRPFKNIDLEKIFQFDFSKDALVMNYERFFPEFEGLNKINEHFKGQKHFNFRDIVNLTALWRPHCQQIVDRIEMYRQAKAKSFSYNCLSEKLNTSLKPNYGIIIYHEDIMRIIAEYTGWDYARSNKVRRLCLLTADVEARNKNQDWIELKKLAPKEVVDLVAEESKWAFCMPHAISFAKFTKQSAVLKTLHKATYFKEIDRFEQKHGVKWDDIGIRMKGVSLHQN